VRSKEAVNLLLAASLFDRVSDNHRTTPSQALNHQYSCVLRRIPPGNEAVASGLLSFPKFRVDKSGRNGRLPSKSWPNSDATNESQAPYTRAATEKITPSVQATLRRTSIASISFQVNQQSKMVFGLRSHVCLAKKPHLLAQCKAAGAGALVSSGQVFRENSRRSRFEGPVSRSLVVRRLLAVSGHAPVFAFDPKRMSRSKQKPRRSGVLADKVYFLLPIYPMAQTVPRIP
jgi:hypothetical protein